MGVDEPYREGRVKRRLRKRFASKESRLELPKALCERERRIMHVLCIVASVYFLGTIVLAEMGHPFWMQAACMVQCAFWCACAGLYESASDWQRAASYSMRRRNATIDRLLNEDTSGLSEAEVIAMSGEAADFRFASGDDVAEAFREELGDE